MTGLIRIGGDKDRRRKSDQRPAITSRGKTGGHARAPNENSRSPSTPDSARRRGSSGPRSRLRSARGGTAGTRSASPRLCCRGDAGARWGTRHSRDGRGAPAGAADVDATGARLPPPRRAGPRRASASPHRGRAAGAGARSPHRPPTPYAGVIPIDIPSRTLQTVMNVPQS